jgi:hypothetical protein
MYRRLSIDRLHALAARFPALLILGARQVGKTTLARQAFAGHAYVDLEDPRTREAWTEDPRFQLDSHAGRGLILDEAQAVPEIFAALRGAIDARRDVRGRFIVLGSAQPALVRGAAESLAGRVGVLELDPLVVMETAAADADVARRWHRHWLCGGFPDAYAAGPDFRDWQEAYLRAYIERDLPQLGVAAEPRALMVQGHAPRMPARPRWSPRCAASCSAAASASRRSSRRTWRSTRRSPPTAARSVAPRRCRRWRRACAAHRLQPGAAQAHHRPRAQVIIHGRRWIP